MLATVAFHRLNLVRTGRDQYGKRKYLDRRIDQAQLGQIYRCVLNALGLVGVDFRN